MGYFDKAMEDIVELDEEEYLAHGRFGSFRKKHKYIDRIWKNGRWVYRYKITGKGYKDAAMEAHRKSVEAYDDAWESGTSANRNLFKAGAHKQESNRMQEWANRASSNAVEARNHANGISGTSNRAKVDKMYWNDAADMHEKNSKSFQEYANRDAKEAKTYARRGEHDSHMSDVYANRSKNYAEKAEKSMDDYYNKSLAGTVEKVKKKLKHDDILDSLAYGEAILHSMFN